MNHVVLIGRTTKDIDLRKTGSGKSVTSFTLAVNRQGKDAGADFVPCVAWEQRAELLHKYVKKGALVALKGSVQTRQQEDQTGKTQWRTEILVNEIQFLETKKQQEPQQQEEQYELPEGAIDISSDDLPF